MADMQNHLQRSMQSSVTSNKVGIDPLMAYFADSPVFKSSDSPSCHLLCLCGTIGCLALSTLAKSTSWNRSFVDIHVGHPLFIPFRLTLNFAFLWGGNSFPPSIQPSQTIISVTIGYDVDIFNQNSNFIYIHTSWVPMAKRCVTSSQWHIPYSSKFSWLKNVVKQRKIVWILIFLIKFLWLLQFFIILVTPPTMLHLHTCVRRSLSSFSFHHCLFGQLFDVLVCRFNAGRSNLFRQMTLWIW